MQFKSEFNSAFCVNQSRKKMGEKPLNTDTVLQRVGGLGKFQILLIIFFAIHNISFGYHYYGRQVIDYVPEVNCETYEKSGILQNVSFDLKHELSQRNLITRRIENLRSFAQDVSLHYKPF